MEAIKDLLLKKFDEIQKRTLSVIDQLDDDDLNWRPNESSNSIANLVVHIQGNVNERILNGIQRMSINRNRDEEFDVVIKSKDEIIDMTNSTYKNVIETLETISDETWMKSQLVRGKERSNLDVILQCATHFSEHLGQMMYIAKMRKNHDYQSTSIPRKK